jgi:histidyl-tRNA synthetase
MDRIGFFLLKEGLGEVHLSKKKKNFDVHIFVKTSLKYFRAKASHFDPYTAVDQVVTKLEKQFKFADKKGIPYVVICGPEEKKKGLVVLKNMASGVQEEIQLADLATRFGRSPGHQNES